MIHGILISFKGLRSIPELVDSINLQAGGYCTLFFGSNPPTLITHLVAARQRLHGRFGRN
jgi:hypothetical protein